MDEGALERGVIVQSDLKGVWDYSYSAKLIQCFPELATTNYLLQEDRTAVECTMGISHIKVKPHKSLPKQKRALWPIPASTINSNTKGHINQNKGYAGSENNIPPLETIEAN